MYTGIRTNSPRLLPCGQYYFKAIFPNKIIADLETQGGRRGQNVEPWLTPPNPFMNLKLSNVVDCDIDAPCEKNETMAKHGERNSAESGGHRFSIKYTIFDRSCAGERRKFTMANLPTLKSVLGIRFQ
jgi:hypothetical protein